MALAQVLAPVLVEVQAQVEVLHLFQVSAQVLAPVLVEVQAQVEVLHLFQASFRFRLRFWLRFSSG